MWNELKKQLKQLDFGDVLTYIVVITPILLTTIMCIIGMVRIDDIFYRLAMITIITCLVSLAVAFIRSQRY